VPVIFLAFSLNRKSTASAISCASGIRCRALRRTIRAR
jgi:hypothetical protein